MSNQTTEAVDTDTRLIFANELAAGAVIVQKCDGYYSSGRRRCEVEAYVHGDTPHLLTVQRVRVGMGACAMVVNEDGIKQAWQEGGNAVITVQAGGPVHPRPEQDQQADDQQGIRALPWWKKALGYGAALAAFLVPYALGAGTILILVAANRLGTH